MKQPFRFSIAFQSNKSPVEYQALAELVDVYPFDVVSVYNDLLFQPALGPLILMAQRLHRAQVGFAALNPYTLHPLEIAGQAAVLDMVSGGRSYMGLVRGSWLDRLGIEGKKSYQTLREATMLVKHLLARDPAPFEGQIFQLAANSTLNYQPLRADVPIMIGTWGKLTARMAGEIANEIKIGGSSNPAMVGVLQPEIAAGEAKAGREAGMVGVCLGAVTVVDEDREAARALVRREAALYIPVVAELDPTLQDPEWLQRVQEAAGRGDYDYVSRQISDEMLDKFAFAGNPQDIIRQVEKLIEAGASRVEFGTPHGLNPEVGINLLGEKVLPCFKS
ncbi:MAG: LLM class flavin-dependent oxidoreductase [Chloroflexi bacterium]|nr:LLM class flavin-dependent oxidoreductase [Chloroflexota bacterium]